jgi:hypothetical protein
MTNFKREVEERKVATEVQQCDEALDTATLANDQSLLDPDGHPTTADFRALKNIS